MNIFAEIIHSQIQDDIQILAAGSLFSSFKHLVIDENEPPGEVTVNGSALAQGEAFSYPFIGKGYMPITVEARGNAILKFYQIR